MKLVEYCMNSREWFRKFESFFYSSATENIKDQWTISDSLAKDTTPWGAWDFVNNSDEPFFASESNPNDFGPAVNKFNCEYPDGFLGKNISYLITECEDSKKRFLFLFDTDDDAGTTALSFKLIWKNFHLLQAEHKITDSRILVFKRELSYEKEMSEYYPFLDKSLPLGILPFCASPVFKKDKLLIMSEVGDHASAIKTAGGIDKKVDIFYWQKKPIFIDSCFDVQEKDIDVFWAGTVPDMPDIEEDCKPDFWTRGKPLSSFSYMHRSRIFKELISIKKRRDDINIVCLDKKVSLEEYFSLIGRSKICIEPPGVGQLNKRFIEYMLLEKCILRMRLRCELTYPIKENVHYASFGDNIKNLENQIDNLLKDPSRIEYFENNAKEASRYLSYGYLRAYIIENVLRFMKQQG